MGEREGVYGPLRLKPAGRVGSRVPPVEQRVDVYFAGSDKPAHPASQFR